MAKFTATAAETETIPVRPSEAAIRRAVRAKPADGHGALPGPLVQEMATVGQGWVK